MGNSDEFNEPSIEQNSDYLIIENNESYCSVDDYIYIDSEYNNNIFITNEIIKITDISEKENISKNKIFEITKTILGIKRQRGKPNPNGKKNKKRHSKYDDDNIIIKIQVHYHNYIFDFANEILKNYGLKKKFLNIVYSEKRDITKENFKNLKSKEIGQILRQNISTKYKRQYGDDKEKNNKLYLEVIKYDSIRKILSETYINIFRNFYYENKREINDYGLNIKLSNNVKTYKDVLEKNKNDSKYIERIKEKVQECYLTNKKPSFIVEKTNPFNVVTFEN